MADAYGVVYHLKNSFYTAEAGYCMPFMDEVLYII